MKIKFFAAALAAVTVCSAFTAFADGVQSSWPPENTEERGYVIRDGAVYDLSGKFLFNVSEEGQLDDGWFLDENFSVGYARSEWSDAYIERAVSEGVIPVLLRYGYTENIDRYQFAVIVYNMLEKSGKISSAEASARFSDTDSKEIAALANMGIISGRSDTVVDPNAYIMREEAAAILTRAAEYAGLTAADDTAPQYGDDDNIPAWANEYVYAAKALGIMQGEIVTDEAAGGKTTVSLFHPGTEITKEESIVSVMRIYDTLNK